jgi:hypothetical protein
MNRWLASSLLLLTATSLPAQEYDVSFFRPSKVGEKLEMEIQMSKEDSQQWNVDGQPLVAANKKSHAQVEFKASSECLAVDNEANATETKFTVRSCAFTLDGKAAPLFNPKDVIVMKEHPRTATVNGEPARPQQLEALAAVFTPLPDQPVRDDQFFAPGHKVKVGDTWPGNAEAIAADMTKKGMKVPKEAVQCNVKLQSAQPKDGIPCLQVAVEMKVNASGSPLPNAPPGIDCKQFVYGIKASADLPVDLKSHRPSDHFEVSMDAEGGGAMKGQDKDRQVTFHLHTELSHDITQKEVP